MEKEQLDLIKKNLMTGLEQLNANNHVFEEEKKQYEFHKPGCIHSGLTPFKDKRSFHKRGYSTSGSIKYQCKACKKITNVLPQGYDSNMYHQQKEIDEAFLVQLILDGRSVKEACEILSLSTKTYYHRLKNIARRFREFQNGMEKDLRDEIVEGQVYVSTDIMERQARDKTYMGIIATSEVLSGYVMRLDVCNNIHNMEDFYNQNLLAHFSLIQDTFGYKEFVGVTDQAAIKKVSDQFNHISPETVLNYVEDQRRRNTKLIVKKLENMLSRFKGNNIIYYSEILKVIYNYSTAFVLDSQSLTRVTPAQKFGLADYYYPVEEILV
jgi:transposase-like protein